MSNSEVFVLKFNEKYLFSATSLSPTLTTDLFSAKMYKNYQIALMDSKKYKGIVGKIYKLTEGEV